MDRILLAARAVRDLRRLGAGPELDRMEAGLQRLSTGEPNLDITPVTGSAPWLRLRVDATWCDARFVHSGRAVPGSAPWSGRVFAELGLARGIHGGADLGWSGRRRLAHGDGDVGVLDILHYAADRHVGCLRAACMGNDQQCTDHGQRKDAPVHSRLEFHASPCCWLFTPAEQTVLHALSARRSGT